MASSGDKAPGGPVDFSRLYARLDEAEQKLSGDQQLEEGHRTRLLAARARLLAAARVEEAVGTLEVLAFRVGGERYALRLLEVDHVVELRALSRLPGSARQVLGLLASRSLVLPVLDLRVLLSLQGGGMSDLTQVVVADTDEGKFGLAVEAVEGRLALQVEKLLPPPAGPFSHLGRDGLVVLDVTKLASAADRHEGRAADGGV